MTTCIIDAEPPITFLHNFYRRSLAKKNDVKKRILGTRNVNWNNTKSSIVHPKCKRVQ